MEFEAPQPGVSEHQTMLQEGQRLREVSSRLPRIRQVSTFGIRSVLQKAEESVPLLWDSSLGLIQYIFKS